MNKQKQIAEQLFAKYTNKKNRIKQQKQQKNENKQIQVYLENGIGCFISYDNGFTRTFNNASWQDIIDDIVLWNSGKHKYYINVPYCARIDLINIPPYIDLRFGDRNI